MIISNASSVPLMPFFLPPRQPLPNENYKTSDATAVILPLKNTVGLILKSLSASGKIVKTRVLFWLS
jgi:hypothetical protein